MKGLIARVDTPWISYTPLAAHTLTTARQVAFGTDGPYAAAIVGVYGSGKSTLIFALLREALKIGQLPIWEEAAAFIGRLVADDEVVLPQEFVARVRSWLSQVACDSEQRTSYLADLERRGRGDVAARLRTGTLAADTGVVLLLDEVEQAHQLLLRRIATDDGQPLRALLDACGPQLRMVLAYAPESYHAMGDADRGRLVTLPVPPIDVLAIQTCYGLPRGHANFAWWASRGRARGVEQVVRGVIEPLRAGLFDSDLTGLGDAIDALPGVFGVPALLRDGMDHRRLRALMDLRPLPCPTAIGGVVCRLGDRRELADRIRHELARRLGPLPELEPLANEVVAVLEAVADDDGCVYLTLDDFGAALRVAEARVVESGRVREPIARLVDEGARIFDALGELGSLELRLPFALRELCDERFPSPFTDPYLPLDDGRVPSEAELDRRFRALAAERGPVLVSAAGGFAVYADVTALARHVQAAALDGASEPLRALVLDAGHPVPAIVELAQFAGHLALVEVGRFHATFLKCLALRSRAGGFGTDMDVLFADSRGDRQLGRKMAWHRDRVAVLVRDLRPRADPDWQTATAYIRQNESFRSTLARLDRDSPALLGLLFALRPLGPAEKSLCARIAVLVAEGSPLRRLAREANPGGRLSGAAVVIDGLLPLGGRSPRWTEVGGAGTREIVRVIERFATQADLRPYLAAWLYAEDRARLEVLLRYYCGLLPDVHRERDALDALRRLDETSRRAAAVVADLERCTGRRQAALSALRLGSFTDHVRMQAGPVEQLRLLAADCDGLATAGTMAWVRALSLWICGVIAARLLKGVEKEQAALVEWERVAANGADMGRRADELQAALVAVGAHRCVDLLRHKRAQLANQLDAVATAARGVDEMRAAVTALAPLADALYHAREALCDSGIAMDEAIEAYLPDLDEAGAHRVLLRRVPEILAELGPGAPRPACRGLLDYIELLRRHAESSRHNRLRLRLEDLLATTMHVDLRVHPDEVAAIEVAWARIPDRPRAALQAELATATVLSTDELQRWIVGAAAKLDLLDQWGDPGHPRLAEVDTRIGLWSLALRVTPDEVREASRCRAKAAAWVQNLRTGILSATVLDALIATAGAGDGSQAYVAIVDAARGLDERLSALRERYTKLAGVYPTLAIAADTPAGAIAAMEVLCLDKHAELETELARLRRIGVVLNDIGERATPIAAELSLLDATRLADRETERLRDALARRAQAMAHWLAGVALPAGLVPPQVVDLAAWREQLQQAALQTEAVRALLLVAQRLGVQPVWPPSTEWPAIQTSLTAQVDQAQAELTSLLRMQAELAVRCRRLGGAAQVAADPRPTLAEAVDRVAYLVSEVERLRQHSLGSASEAARSVYAAVLAGGGPELPAAVAELVGLGLLRTVEDGP